MSEERGKELLHIGQRCIENEGGAGKGLLLTVFYLNAECFKV